MRLPQFELDAEALARTTGGRWERYPSADWRYRGLCYSAFDHEPHQLVLVRTRQMEYGVAPERLDARLCRGGLLAAPDVDVRAKAAPVLRVDSVPHALQRLVAQLRRTTNTTIVAVTGSVGKTSSCHLLQHLLSRTARVRSNGQKNLAPTGEAFQRERWK